MKILVANRGEIAIRVMRACREMGLASVAIYSDPDRLAPHVRYADQAYRLDGSDAGATYLSIDRIVETAKRAGADAVHPGYGFLAENHDFAAACRDAGLIFIGPSPEAIRRMGSKTGAREAAIAAGVPVVPGTREPLSDSIRIEEIAGFADEIGYPLLIKAVAGGGGKGMRVAEGPGDLASAVQTARSEARSAFGDSAIYLERRLERSRHIEIQLMADEHGQTVAFVERECSIQRRHQKVIEEAPSTVVSPVLRAAMAEAAVAVARRVSYTNAGTIEFLVDDAGRFYFLEMNTRLQVEHPVTELVTGIDLVQWQIRIARGERLTLEADDMLVPRGHAIECRIYAEDPDNGFLPSPGTITSLRAPDGPGIRHDSGVEAGYTVPIHYDPMISKLIAWGPDRPAAIARMRRALNEFEIGGIETGLPFFRWILDTEDFRAGRFDTTTLDRELAARGGRPFVEVSDDSRDLAAVAAALHRYLQSHAGASGHPAATRSAEEWTRAARREALRS